MKKFVICLLLICTICLGCFALTACDKGTKEVSKIEFIKNVYYNPSLSHSIKNVYWFRIWYPVNWAGWINKTITVKYKVSHGQLPDEYQIFPDDEIIKQTLDADKYGTNNIIPDTWIYIPIICDLPTEIHIQVVAVLTEPYSGTVISEDELISAQFDLRGTFKHSSYEGEVYTHS